MFHHKSMLLSSYLLLIGKAKVFRRPFGLMCIGGRSRRPFSPCQDGLLEKKDLKKPLGSALTEGMMLSRHETPSRNARWKLEIPSV